MSFGLKIYFSGKLVNSAFIHEIRFILFRFRNSYYHFNLISKVLSTFFHCLLIWTFHKFLKKSEKFDALTSRFRFSKRCSLFCLILTILSKRGAFIFPFKVIFLSLAFLRFRIFFCLVEESSFQTDQKLPFWLCWQIEVLRKFKPMQKLRD